MSPKPIITDGIIFSIFILVCLAAMLQPNEEQLLELGNLSIVVLVTFAVSCLVGVTANGCGMRTTGALLFPNNNDLKNGIKSYRFPYFWGWQIGFSFTSLLLLSFFTTHFSMSELLDQNGFEGAVRLFRGIANPNFKILPQAVMNIVETTLIAFLATCLAIPLAFILSFVCAKNIMSSSRNFIVYFLLRTIFNFVRAIEPFIWAIIFSVWVGIGPFAGMLALMVHSVASLVKQYSEIIESVSPGPIEGIESTGARKLQIIWFGIVPQVIIPFISFTIYRWDINVRMATVIGLVGGGGIGTMLIKYQGLAMWPEVGCIIFVIAVAVWALDNTSAYLRESIK